MIITIKIVKFNKMNSNKFRKIKIKYLRQSKFNIIFRNLIF